MAIALKAFAAAVGSGNTNSVITAGIDTTGADLLVFVVSSLAGAGTLQRDTVGGNNNTYTALTAYQNGIQRLRLFYCKPTYTGAGHTFEVQNNGPTYPAIAAFAFSGVKATSPVDQEIGLSTGSGTSAQPGSLTPSQDDCLLIAAANVYPGGSVTIDSGFSTGSGATVISSMPGAYFGGGIAYKIQTTAGAENPTWSWTTSGNKLATMVSFLAAPVSGVPFDAAMTGGFADLTGGFDV